MQDINQPVPSPSADDSDPNLVVPSDGSPDGHSVWLEGFKAALKTAERVAFFFGLGWFLHEHFDSALMEKFVTPLAIILNSIGVYLLALWCQKSKDK